MRSEVAPKDLAVKEGALEQTARKQGKAMSLTKPMLGLAVGGTLGLLDGLSGFLEPSLAPAMTSVGCLMAHSHGRLVQPNSAAIRYSAARVSVSRLMCMERTSSGSVRSRPPNMAPATRSSRSGW